MAQLKEHLEKFANWLNQVKHEKKTKSDPKSLTVELKDFTDILLSNSVEFEKLIKQYKRKLIALQNSLGDSPTKELSEFQKAVSSSLTKVTEQQKRIKEAKHQSSMGEIKQAASPIHLGGREVSFQRHKAPNIMNATHLKISKRKNVSGKTKGL